jgi:hypothetical protein
METDPIQFVNALANDPPTYLSRLGRIVGDVEMSFRSEDGENTGFLRRPSEHRRGHLSPLVESLWIRYAFDWYHSDPTRPRDVQLLEYSVVIRCDRAVVESVLAQRFGPPHPVVDDQEVQGKRAPRKYASYHPFYIDQSDAPRTILTWHAEVPRFAIPVPDPEVRRAWLGELRRRIETATTVDELDAFCKATMTGAGIEITGTLNRTFNRYAEFKSPSTDGRDYWIRFQPPLPARLLVDVFDWTPAVGVSHDVHMSSWHVERRGDGWRPLGGAHLHWEIDARLSAWPSGPPETGARFARPARGIGDSDEVTTLAVQPRFR